MSFPLVEIGFIHFFFKKKKITPITKCCPIHLSLKLNGKRALISIVRFSEFNVKECKLKIFLQNELINKKMTILFFAEGQQALEEIL